MKNRIFLSCVAMVSIFCLSACDGIPGVGKGFSIRSQAAPAAPQAPIVVPQQPAPMGIPGQPVAVAPAPVQAPAAPVPPAPTGDALTDKINMKKFEASNAFVPTCALVKSVTDKNKAAAFQVQLPGPPFCHTFVASVEDTAGNVDVVLTSPAGTVVAQDATAETTAVVANNCPQLAGVYKVTVTTSKPALPFAIQVFSK